MARKMERASEGEGDPDGDATVAAVCLALQTVAAAFATELVTHKSASKVCRLCLRGCRAVRYGDEPLAQGTRALARVPVAGGGARAQARARSVSRAEGRWRARPARAPSASGPRARRVCE